MLAFTPIAAKCSAPQKRLLEGDQCAQTMPAPKIARQHGLDDDTPSVSTHVESSIASDFSFSEEEVPSIALRKTSPSIACFADHQGADGLARIVKSAMDAFVEVWISFALERDRGSGDEAQRDERASKASEMLVAGKYEEMKAILLDLVPLLGVARPDPHGANYQIVEFQGRKPPSKKCKDDGEATRAKLEWLRGEPRGRAWDACCAIMAALSARSEKSWLEAYGTYADLEDLLTTLPLCKSKKSARRKLAIRNFIKEQSQTHCGYFQHYLLSSTTNLRIALASSDLKLTPASLVITNRLSLWDALVSLDGDFPFCGEAKSRAWCMKAGRQFAFQLVNFGIDPESRKSRAAANNLKPDAELRELLRSKKTVVQLEIVAALAPRNISKSLGLSEIVKAELASVMRVAKSRREAVVFCLGSSEPHTLAEKVYMRPPISNYGLRCGYLRWRESACVPWAREATWDDRTCLCLQMP